MVEVTFDKIHNAQKKALHYALELIDGSDSPEKINSNFEKFTEWLDRLDDLIDGRCIDDLECTEEEKKTLIRQGEVLIALINLF